MPRLTALLPISSGWLRDRGGLHMAKLYATTGVQPEAAIFVDALIMDNPQLIIDVDIKELALRDDLEFVPRAWI